MRDIKINVFRDGGEWFYALWIDGEYDGSGSLEIDASSSDEKALEAAQCMRLNVRREGTRTVERVGDL